MAHIMTIELVMKTRLVGVMVGGSGQRNIKTIFFAIRHRISNIYLPHSIKDNVEPPCFDLAPLVYCGVALLVYPQGC
jgi:hypothetical protein